MLVWRSPRGGIVTVVGFSIPMLTNLAESTFFSPGGTGLLVLLIVGWAATSPAGGQCIRLPVGRPRRGEAAGRG